MQILLNSNPTPACVCVCEVNLIQWLSLDLINQTPLYTGLYFSDVMSSNFSFKTNYLFSITKAVTIRHQRINLMKVIYVDYKKIKIL